MVGMLLALAPGVARATVVTFDDLPAAGLGGPIPNGYGGLNWDNFYYINGDFDLTSGYFYGIVSPGNVAYNAFGAPADVMSVSSSTPFFFNGAYFTAAWNDNLQVTVTGYSGATPVDSETVTLSATAPTFESFNYAGVTEVTFDSFGGTPHPGYDGSGEHFAMDNFTYNQRVRSITPEPVSLMFFGTGLVAVSGYVARRRMQRKA